MWEKTVARTKKMRRKRFYNNKTNKEGFLGKKNFEKFRNFWLPYPSPVGPYPLKKIFYRVTQNDKKINFLSKNCNFCEFFVKITYF